MNLIGRYDKVRALWTTGAVGHPYIIDHRRDAIYPAGGEEWWKSPNGQWVPIPRGGIGGRDGNTQYPVSLLWDSGNANAVSLFSQAINAASGYTFGSAGNAIAWRIKPIETFTIANIYYYISAVNGTQANVNTVDCYIRNSPTVGKPVGAGATLYASTLGTNPNSDSAGGFVGWHKIPISFTIYPDQYYWIILSRTQNATDYPTLTYAMAPFFNQNFTSTYLTGTASADGYNTLSTFSGNTPLVVLESPQGNVIGNSVATSSTVTSTSRRGLMFQVAERIGIFGMMVRDITNNISGLEVYDNTNTVPGTGPLGIGTSPTHNSSNTINGYLIRHGFPCARNVPYRIVLSFSGNTLCITKMSIGEDNGYVRQLRAAKFVPTWYYAMANGTTDWSNDDQDSLPIASVLVDDQIAANVPASRIFTGY